MEVKSKSKFCPLKMSFRNFKEYDMGCYVILNWYTKIEIFLNFDRKLRSYLKQSQVFRMYVTYMPPFLYEQKL